MLNTFDVAAKILVTCWIIKTEILKNEEKSYKNPNIFANSQVRLIAVLDPEGAANHTQFFDDGETANTLHSKYYSLLNFAVANNTLNVKHLHNGYLGK